LFINGCWLKLGAKVVKEPTSNDSNQIGKTRFIRKPCENGEKNIRITIDKTKEIDILSVSVNININNNMPKSNSKSKTTFESGKNTDVPVVPMSGIQRCSITTKLGNTLSFFYNPENNLVVVDLVAANEKGGNELVRTTLDENLLLKHTY
jgi:hypothetical protein